MTTAERITVQEMFLRADRMMAEQIRDGRAHQATVLATFTALRDAARPLDPELAELLIPKLSETATPGGGA